MASIQIRNIPEDIYHYLEVLAQKEHRSIPQQVLFMLKCQIEGWHSTQKLRKQTLEEVAAHKWPPLSFDPVEELRKDRDSR